MLVISIAVLVAAAYSAYSLRWARLLYKQTKIKQFETAKGRKNWDRDKDKIALWCGLLGNFWPGIIVVGGMIVTWKGLKWLITHDQEIPAETEENIKRLEKEIFGEEPEDAKPEVKCFYCLGEHRKETCPYVKIDDIDQKAKVEAVTDKSLEKQISNIYDKLWEGIDHEKPTAVKQKAKAGKGSTVIQVASGNGKNYYSGKSICAVCNGNHNHYMSCSTYANWSVCDND
jgi:hypothetical protein